ncbi:MAG: hypothetical protein ABI781_06640 [Burkholderiales bacterium]
MRIAGTTFWGAAATRAADLPQPARDTLRGVRLAGAAAAGLAALVQLLFFYGVEDNLASTLLALLSSLIGIGYALGTRRFCAHPISALILLLYTITATAGALMVKSLEASALADRLQVPVTTYAVLLGAQIALLVADQLYLRVAAFGTLRGIIARRALQPLGLMRWPTDLQFWLLGAIGCASVLMTGTDFESDASFGLASAGAKLIRAFGFLKFAPFLIPFRDALSGIPSRTRLPLLPLALYFVALVGISFATNSRSTFADAVPTIGICLLTATALGRFDIRRVAPTKLLAFALVALIAASLLSRVSLAMVVVRDYRHNADVGMLVRMTAEALFNSEWLAAAKAKMDTAVTVGNYSEDYVDSRFLARFILTKFHDNILYYFSLMGPDQIASYKGFMLERIAATLPDPLLRPLGISVNKQDLIVSNGDYIIYIVDGWGLGGFKTGSMIAEVFGVFGAAFPLVIVGAGLMLFVVHDAFAARSPFGRLALAPLMILLVWNLVGTTAAFGLGAETVTAIPAGIVRGLPQNILAYLIATALVRAATRIAGRGT